MDEMSVWGYSFEFWQLLFGQISIPMFIVGAVGALVLLFSGCWAADVAERYRESDFRAFLLGVFIPFAYPILLARRFAMQDAKAKALEVPEEALKVGGSIGKQLEQAAEKRERLEKLEYNFEYFSNLEANEDGHRNGSFYLQTVDGDRFHCKQIRKLYPDRAVFVFDLDEGERSIRLAYDKIKRFSVSSKEEA